MASVGQEILNVPMGDMIRQMAFAIADAQFQLDQASVVISEVMSGQKIKRNTDGTPVLVDGKIQTIDTRVFFGGKDADGNDQKLSLIELGFTPNFYQFVDTLIEVKIAIRISHSTDSGTTSKSSVGTYDGSWNASLGWFSVGSQSRSVTTASSVDATYAAKYNYSAEGASLIRTKLVPVPPPAILEERIRELFTREKKDESDDDGGSGPSGLVAPPAVKSVRKRGGK